MAASSFNCSSGVDGIVVGIAVGWEEEDEGCSVLTLGNEPESASEPIDSVELEAGERSVADVWLEEGPDETGEDAASGFEGTTIDTFAPSLDVVRVSSS